MINIKCFDVVSMVVDEANEQYSDNFVFNKDKYKILKQYCEAIDYIKDEIGAAEYEAEVSDEDKTVSISVTCSSLFVDSLRHAFCQILKRSISCSLSYLNDDEFKIKLVFPSLWDFKESDNE